MTDGMKSAIGGAVIGAILTGIFSIGLSIAEKDSIEKYTVDTLAGYFDSVDKDMSYEDALKFIYEDLKEKKEENKALKNELDSLKVQVNTYENNESAIESAKAFADLGKYSTALTILNDVADKTPEMQILIADYSKKYENQIIEQADSLKGDNKYDEALDFINEALVVFPDSQILKNKQKDIEGSYPQNMTDVVPAYQSGGNPYKEYSAQKSGGTEYFTMGGVKYTNGMTFSADKNIFDDVSWAIYNLNNEYSTLEFVVCHVDGTDNGSENTLHIFYDGVLKEEISLAPDMSPKSISLNVSGVVQLKLQVYPSGIDHPLYGLGNPILK